MLISFGTTSLSIPNPSLNLSYIRVSNPSSLQHHLPLLRISHPSIATVDLPRNGSTIRMGGGPRTFPGGVSKWQWKRMQAKKAKQLLKARLCRERQMYEMRKRAELQAAISELERPWEVVKRAPALFSVKADEQVKVLADRFQRPGGYDLWSETDGPQLFRSLADGLPSARFFPKGVVHSTRPYGRVTGIAGNSSNGKELPPSSSGSDPETGFGDSNLSEINGSVRSRQYSNRRRHRGKLMGEGEGELGDSVVRRNSLASYLMEDVEAGQELDVLDSSSRADNGMKGRRGLYDDRNRWADVRRNSEGESDLGADVHGERYGGNYSRKGSSGNRGRNYGNRQRHGSEDLYRLDSERLPIDGGVSDSGIKGRRGLYDDPKRWAAVGRNPMGESDLGAGVSGERFGGSYSRKGSSGSRGRNYGNKQRHGSEDLYRLDSKRAAIDGEVSDSGMKGRRGLYDDCNQCAVAGRNPAGESDWRTGVNGERFGRSYGRNGSSSSRGRNYGNRRRHGSEDLYKLDSERVIIDGEVSDSVIKGRRGLYDDPNRWAVAGRNPMGKGVGGERFGGSYSRKGSSSSMGRNYGNRQRHGSEDLYRLDLERVIIDGEVSDRIPSTGRGRYHGSNRRFSGRRSENISVSDSEVGSIHRDNSARIPFVDDGKSKSSHRQFHAGKSENL